MATALQSTVCRLDLDSLESRPSLNASRLQAAIDARWCQLSDGLQGMAHFKQHLLLLRAYSPILPLPPCADLGDRDTNAAASIRLITACQEEGLPRPTALTRPNPGGGRGGGTRQGGGGDGGDSDGDGGEGGGGRRRAPGAALRAAAAEAAAGAAAGAAAATAVQQGGGAYG